MTRKKIVKFTHLNPLTFRSVAKYYPGLSLRDALITEENFIARKMREETMADIDRELIEEFEAPPGRGARCKNCRSFNAWVEKEDQNEEYICYPCRHEHEQFKRQIS